MLSTRLRCLTLALAALLFLGAPEAKAETAHDCPAGMSCTEQSGPCSGNLIGGFEFSFGPQGMWWSVEIFSFEYCYYRVTWADGSQSNVGIVW